MAEHSLLPYTLHPPTVNSITAVKINRLLRKKQKTIFYHPPSKKGARGGAVG
jgi:hypothetical protein